MVTLKKYVHWQFALAPPLQEHPNRHRGSATGEKDLAKSAKGLMKGKIKITPAVLKHMDHCHPYCFLGFPIDATPAVMQVAMFAPRERAIPLRG